VRPLATGVAHNGLVGGATPRRRWQTEFRQLFGGVWFQWAQRQGGNGCSDAARLSTRGILRGVWTALLGKAARGQRRRELSGFHFFWVFVDPKRSEPHGRTRLQYIWARVFVKAGKVVETTESVYAWRLAPLCRATSLSGVVVVRRTTHGETTEG